MKNEPAYKDSLSASIHEVAKGLYDIGAMDIETMRRFDKSCLTPIGTFLPEEIAALRAREGVSQAIFAYCLNVKTKLVSEWERGEKKPSGPSLKLLSLVRDKGLNAIR